MVSISDTAVRRRISVWSWFVCGVAFLTLAGFALRVWGIDLRSLSHPEVYVPGLRLVPDISEPPIRDTFMSALTWHFHDEPHPLGWYLAMFGWTEIFGTSQLSLRMPSALFGAASIPLIALVGRQIWTLLVGLLAALLLSFHGFHIFWSQEARMYTAGMFFALLSTWLLLKLVQKHRPEPKLELGYALVCIAGIQSVELFWPVLLMQMTWLCLISDGFRWNGAAKTLLAPLSAGPRLFQVQIVVFLLSLPSLAHSAYQARDNAAQRPSIEGMLEYLGFGFLFADDHFPAVPLSVPILILVAVSVACIALIVFGLAFKGRPSRATAGGTVGLPQWVIAAAFVASVATLIFIGTIAYRRNLFLASMAIFSVIALYLPAIAAFLRHAIRQKLPEFDNWLSTVSSGKLLLCLLALLAPALLYLSSYVVTLIAPRAWLVFLPALLLLAAGGIGWLFDVGRYIGASATVLVLGMLAASDFYAWQKPGSPNDYQGLARAMAPAMKSDDLVLVRNRSWPDSPFFYYLPEANYVAKDWDEVLASNVDSRVWLVTWPDLDTPRDWQTEALQQNGYVSRMSVERLRARAELYERAVP